MTRDNRPLGAVLKSRLFSIILEITGVVFSKIMADASIYELFIRVPGVHTPRVTLEPGRQEWNALRVEFYLNTPTLTWFVVLIGSILCACSSLMLDNVGRKSAIFEEKLQNWSQGRITSLFLAHY